MYFLPLRHWLFVFVSSLINICPFTCVYACMHTPMCVFQMKLLCLSFYVQGYGVVTSNAASLLWVGPMLDSATWKLSWGVCEGGEGWFGSLESFFFLSRSRSGSYSFCLKLQNKNYHQPSHDHKRRCRRLYEKKAMRTNSAITDQMTCVAYGDRDR